MARRAFAPSDEQRRLVTVWSSYGIPQEDIATEVGLRSPKTLRKHFRKELGHGRIGANIKVGQTLRWQPPANTSPQPFSGSNGSRAGGPGSCHRLKLRRLPILWWHLTRRPHESLP
jgi:hypothetical protein